MSERTTIGGTVYEVVGSSNSNLLLKCNGTARIQWGNKLIDLIKNGKVVSDTDSDNIYTITDESKMVSNGIYIINTNESSQIWIYKNGKKYNLTGADLYISATNKQDITVEQKQQALENLGVCYNDINEAKQANILNGFVYIIKEKSFYTVKDGVFEEFEAKVKNVTVELNNEEVGERISNSVKVVISVGNEDYLILSDKRITAKRSIHVKDSEQIGSEDADATRGYRLYMYGGKSYLDVDKVNVRDGLPSSDYIETTYADFKDKIKSENLQAHKWYLIKDFQNPWKMVKESEIFRPILIRALTNSTTYPKGYLFEDQRVSICYDPNYNENITQTTLNQSVVNIQAKGKITWMCDWNNNEASFDFLDYYDVDGNALTTLHDIQNSELKSIFPTKSYNNKLIINNVYGTVINNRCVDNDSTYKIDFKNSNCIMCNNILECNGLTLSETCNNFHSNILKNTYKLNFTNDCINSQLSDVYYLNNTIISNNYIEEAQVNPINCYNKLENVTIKSFVNSTLSGDLHNSTFGHINNSTIDGNIMDSSFGDLDTCIINNNFYNVSFKNIDKCTFDNYPLSNITSYINLSEIVFTKSEYEILYSESKTKDIYSSDSGIKIVCPLEHVFHKGMILMHSGFDKIPEGWAVCDGGTYTYNGNTVTVPDLRGRFIKAVTDTNDVGKKDNEDLHDNLLTISEEHLPKHSHPHKEHTHSLSNMNVSVEDSGDLNIDVTSDYNHLEPNTKRTFVSEITDDSITFKTSTIQEYRTVEDDDNYTVTGGSHTHSVNTLSGTIYAATSSESNKTWENKAINIEPNYYALIFIIKL